MRLHRQKTQLKVLTSREAQIFEALADAYCAPSGELPAIAQTDTVAFIDDLTSRAPLRNRLGFHLLLAFMDLAPIVRGQGRRLRRLDREHRARFLRGLDKSRWSLLALPGKLLKMLTMMSYYGSIETLQALGYDPSKRVERGRALRAQRSQS